MHQVLIQHSVEPSTAVGYSQSVPQHLATLKHLFLGLLRMLSSGLKRVTARGFIAAWHFQRRQLLLPVLPSDLQDKYLNCFRDDKGKQGTPKYVKALPDLGHVITLYHSLSP